MITKHNWRIILMFVVGCFSVGCLSVACKTSSHTTEYTFEYTNEPVQTKEPVHAMPGEYQMESPGTMVVDPSRGQ